MNDAENKTSTSHSIRWTTNELQIWVQAGLIDIDLLEENKIDELANFIIANKEKLYACYHELESEFPYQVILPAAHEWNTTYQLQVIDRKTGQIIKTLDRIENIDLVDGLSFKVKVQDLENWKKETAVVKKLTDTQKDHLKRALTELSKNGQSLFDTKTIVAIIEEVLKSTDKVSTYPVGGHIIDQKLPKAQKQNIDPSIDIHVKGIRNLSVSEHNIIKTISLLLEQKKQNQEIEEPHYNQTLAKSLLTAGYNSPPRSIRLKPHEFYRAYMGRPDYSGSDIKFMNKALFEFAQRQFPVTYEYREKIEDEGINHRIEFLSPLIEVFLITSNLTDKEKEKVNNGDKSTKHVRSEFIFCVNPIFTHQIENKFIVYPADINRRLTDAAGGHSKVTASMHLLLDWVLRDISAKRPKNEINEDKLIETLELEKQRKQGRKSRMNNRIKKDIEAIKKLGPIKNWEKKKNSSGGSKFIFEYKQLPDLW